MFYFDLMNKALTDTNVNDIHFRALYLIVNNCSMNETESIEMYNAFLMEKLHYSESTIKRCIKVLEQNGYISVKRATKKRTPNIITLMPIKNECTDEVTNAVRNEVRNDTLYNNIDNNKDNIHSIQSNINEDNGIPYDVYCEQQLAKEKAEREKKASYDLLSMNEDNSNVADNSNEITHRTDIENDNLNEDNGIDYEENEERQKAKEITSYDNKDNFNVGNVELQGIRGIQCIGTETENSKEDNDIDTMIEAYEQGLIEAAEHSSIPQQGNNPKGIDWDAWREQFDRNKKGMLNAKCKTDYDLWRKHCNESLKFAKEHMRAEKYDKELSTFDKWYAASKPHFSYKEKQSPIQPSKVFDREIWYNYECVLNYVPEEREKTAREMKQYLQECGKSPKGFLKDLKEQYAIVV